jgi:uncharacterized alkaline shock family protein YloU
MRRLRVLANAGAFLLTAGIGVTLILGGVGILSFGSLTDYFERIPGTIFLILVGALFLLVAARFVLALLEERANAVLFSQQGEWGRIELSPHAVKEFISDILRTHVGIDGFHIGLKHKGDGVGIVVHTTLSPEQRVTDIGLRIQRELVQHVTDRTGVDVQEVTVLVRNIRQAEASAEAGSDASTEPRTQETVIISDVDDA